MIVCTVCGIHTLHERCKAHREWDPNRCYTASFGVMPSFWETR